MPDLRQTFSALLLTILAAWLLVGPVATAQEDTAGPQVIEEDLEDTGLEALPVTLPPLDEAEIQQLFDEAEALFQSVDQEISLPRFGALLDRLEPHLAAGVLSEPMRDLFVRSLAYRARMLFNLDERESVEAELSRMLSVQPEADLDRAEASPKLVDQFDALRRRLIGEVEFILEPTDAVVEIDGRAVDALSGPVGVLAGQRQLAITLPGHLSIEQPLEVEAGSLITLERTLERVSAVLRLNTRPAGATVTLDGEVRGVTEGTAPVGFLPQGQAAVYRREEFSDELVIDGIGTGVLRLEVSLEGYRTSRQELRIHELLDYPMPPIVLERESGSLVFNDFPRGAEIRIDGQARAPDNPGASRPRLALSPGSYHVTVSAGPSRMFSTQLQLADRQTMEINVRLRPGLAYLGVLGGDQDTARNLDQSLRLTLADSGKWTLLNFSARAPGVLADSGVSAEALRAVEAESAGGSRSAVDWRRVQQAVDVEVPGLVYLVAVPENDLVATRASLWIWPRAPGPAEPDRVSLPLRDPAALTDLKKSFNSSVRLSRPWVGAMIIDTNGAPHPMVVDVSPASPAEAAGLAVGDLIAGVAGVPVTTRAAFDERIAAAEIGEVLDLGVQSAAGPRALELTLGSSPDLLATSRAGLLDSVAYTELVLLAEKAPANLAWVVEIDQALIQMRAHEWTEAARRLRSIRAPQTSHGVGQATVDYLLGIVLNAAGSDFAAGARQHFEKAAGVAGARLFHNDGAWVAPRARARLRALGG